MKALTSLLLCCALLCWRTDGADTPTVTSVPEGVRETLRLDPFYQKYVAAGGLPIVGSGKVSDFALLEASYLVRHMLAARPEIISVLASNRVKIVIMAHDEYTTDLPEQRNMRPKLYWDKRARGLGGQTCSGAEENLLNYPGDPYSTENILIHEFAHVIYGRALRRIDPTFDQRLREAYAAAAGKELWKGTYAATNPDEYWAESAQDWFDNNRHDDAQHNHVHTRAQLKEYDPAVAKLCAEVFGDLEWRYQKPFERPPSERAHLAGYDPSQAPRFQWREAPLSDRPQVQFETDLGVIELELNATAAPVTTSNFVKYVEKRLYNGGSFFRTVTLSNQADNAVKIQVVQGGANPSQTNEYLAPIRLERTRDTGLRHLDGTISMARDGPDTAQDNFFICIGDQPELDYGGKRNPDGQGFAAFGRVTKGMDVIRKIQTSTAEGQALKPPVRIQRAIRLE